MDGAPGDKVTLVATCRDVLRVIRAEPGAETEELKPVINEIKILSGELEEVWHDKWCGYAPLSMTTRKRRPD